MRILVVTGAVGLPRSGLPDLHEVIIMGDLGHTIASVFVCVAVVIVAARLMGMLFRKLGQPAVLGEILAGILLGPTLLGALPGNLTETLFPMDTRPFLSLLAQLGLVLFMFIVGLEVDMSLVRGRQRAATVVSLSSVALPFGLGVLVAVPLYPMHDTVNGEQIGFLPLALFLGVAVAITAFPVLARILSERGMQRTPTGVLALACAAINDVIAWGLLAFVVAISVGGSLGGVVLLVVETAVFAAIMFVGVRPLLARLVGRYERAGRLTPDLLAVVLVGILVSSYITEEIGVHAIFGAFLFGAAMPRRGAAALTAEILKQMEQITVLLLLPVFFVVAGLGVNIGGLGVSGLWQLGLILLVAISGKIIGAFAAARAQKIPRRQAGALGVLMNTRGLTELVILQIGRELGVLDDELFTILVVMALVTTAMTGPLLKLVYPDRAIRNEIAAAERALLGHPEDYTVLVAVSDRERDAELVPLACDLLGPRAPSSVVLSRLLPTPTAPVELGSGIAGGLAELVRAGDSLRTLSRIADERGVRCTVLSHYSTDRRADLTEQAGNLGADVVLVPRDWDGSDEPPIRSSTVAVVTLADTGHGAVTANGDGTGGPLIAVVGDGGRDEGAAVRLGVHLAVQRGEPLLVRSAGGWRAGRRASATVDGLRGRGFRVEQAADGTPAGVLVLAAGAAAGAEPESGITVIAVRAGESDVDLDEVVATISPR